MDRRRVKNNFRGIEGEETVTRIYYMKKKSLFNKIKIKNKHSFKRGGKRVLLVYLKFRNIIFSPNTRDYLLSYLSLFNWIYISDSKFSNISVQRRYTQDSIFLG